MGLLELLIIIGVLFLIFGNPHVGGRVYPGYADSGFGYWPSGVGLIVVLIVLFMLFGGGIHTR